MLRKFLLAGLVAAATVPFTSTPASAICVIYVQTGDIVDGVGDIGPYNCNFCPVVERPVEKYAGDVMNCWT